MDLDWTAAQRALHQRFRERTGPDDWSALAAEQVLGLGVPTAYGGLGCAPLDTALALEGLGYGCRDLGLLIAAGAHMWAAQYPILAFGSPAQRQAYLPGLVSGELVGAHAITEEGSGSDALAMDATARRSGDGYVLNGRKRFVTNAPTADVLVCYATLGKQFGFTGVTAFLVERGDPGVRIEPERQKMGLHSSPWGQVVLEDCFVAESRRLGAEKQGSKIFAAVMRRERTLMLTPLLGAMERQIEDCLAYARTRRQFQKRIGSFQSLSHRIVEMQVRLEAARSLVRQAAWELSDDRPAVARQSYFPELVKLYVSEAAVETFSDAMQVFGGYGYTAEAGVEQRLRDALGTRISSGTSDLQRTLIAAKLGMR